MSASRTRQFVKVPGEAGARRWREAAPKIAMACCEAGYPATCDYFPPPGVLTLEGPYVHYQRRPPAEVLRKAFELAGLGDLYPDPGPFPDDDVEAQS